MAQDLQAWAVLNAANEKICDYSGLEDFDTSATASVPVEPQEGGRLYASDKVKSPIEVTVTLLFSGDYITQDRAMKAIERLRATTALLKVVTPIAVYENLAIVGYSFRRSSSKGASLLAIELSLQQILSASVTKGKAFNYSPKNPSSAKEDKGSSLAHDAVHSLFGGGKK